MKTIGIRAYCPPRRPLGASVMLLFRHIVCRCRPKCPGPIPPATEGLKSQFTPWAFDISIRSDASYPTKR